MQVLFCSSFGKQVNVLIRIAVQFGGRTVDKNDVPVIKNFRIPLMLLGCSLPLSSIMQCNLKSLNLRDAPSLNTFSNMMFIIAFTRMSGSF